VKRRLRSGFVQIVDAGERMGILSIAAQARHLAPGPYQWFASRYKAYCAQHDEPARVPASEVDVAAQTSQPEDALGILPENLSADERACFVRLRCAADTRRLRILW
jgi:hypothetical protein